MLETRADGPPNWQFGEARDTSPGPPALPRIDRLEISDASVRYHDLGSGRNLTAELPRVAGRTDPDLKLNASGKVQGERLDLDITGAALAQLENGAEPYPASLALKFGQSDLHGDLSLDLFKEVPVIRAKLASDRVVTTDFTALFERQQRVNARSRSLPATRSVRSRKCCPKPARKASAAPPSTQTSCPRSMPSCSIRSPSSKVRSLALRDLNLNAALHDRLPTLTLTGGGQYKGKPVVLDLQVGAEGEQDQTLPMSSMPGSRLGQTRITAVRRDQKARAT